MSFEEESEVPVEQKMKGSVPDSQPLPPPSTSKISTKVGHHINEENPLEDL
jgi:hypothetical protein